jgi:hypothetical protein
VLGNLQGVGHFPDGDKLPVIGMLEEELGQQSFRDAHIGKGAGRGRAGRSIFVQRLLIDEVQIQETFAQIAAKLLLSVEGQSQLVLGQHPGFEKAFRQIHGITLIPWLRAPRGSGGLARTVIDKDCVCVTVIHLSKIQITLANSLHIHGNGRQIFKETTATPVFPAVLSEITPRAERKWMFL